MAKTDNNLFVTSDEEDFDYDARNGPFHEDSDSDSHHVRPTGGYPAQQIDSDDGERFCICRGVEEGWMVQCDHCQEWFHGDCVDLSQSEDEDVLDSFACSECEETGVGQTVWSTQEAKDRFEERKEQAETRRILERESMKRRKMGRTSKKTKTVEARLVGKMETREPRAFLAGEKEGEATKVDRMMRGPVPLIVGYQTQIDMDEEEIDIEQTVAFKIVKEALEADLFPCA